MRRTMHGMDASRIEVLEMELEDARETIVSMLPETVGDATEDFLCLGHWDDFADARRKYCEALIESSEGSSTEYFGGRVCPCPLCGSLSQSPTRPGYRIPEGLERHLIGHGRMEACGVMKHVTALVETNLRRRTGKTRRQWFSEARIREQSEKERRRKTETVLRLSPRGQPLLMEEERSGKSRSVDEMEWAVRRLEGIGFVRKEEENVLSFEFRFGRFVVMADPRSVGRIEFYVSRQNPKRGDDRRRYGGDFYLLDSWKTDLRTKLLVRGRQAAVRWYKAKDADLEPLGAAEDVDALRHEKAKAEASPGQVRQPRRGTAVVRPSVKAAAVSRAGDSRGDPRCPPSYAGLTAYAATEDELKATGCRTVDELVEKVNKALYAAGSFAVSQADYPRNKDAFGRLVRRWDSMNRPKP